jgi:hypothetical protein
MSEDLEELLNVHGRSLDSSWIHVTSVSWLRVRRGRVFQVGTIDTDPYTRVIPWRAEEFHGYKPFNVEDSVGQILGSVKTMEQCCEKE